MDWEVRWKDLQITLLFKSSHVLELALVSDKTQLPYL